MDEMAGKTGRGSLIFTKAGAIENRTTLNLQAIVIDCSIFPGRSIALAPHLLFQKGTIQAPHLSNDPRDPEIDSNGIVMRNVNQ
jgi:hypothetical protein